MASDSTRSFAHDGAVEPSSTANTAPFPGPADFPLPESPPGYILHELIGHGGMGAVYRATDVALKRDVAVKFLQDRYSPDSIASARFMTEAWVLGQLQHPGIPPVYDVGRLACGRPFLAMKLIKGKTLEELLDGRADPGVDRGRFVLVFEQLCQAVGYAHARRVIHRDLKPSNLMVGAFGEVQVMDWGLAKLLGEAETEATREPEDGPPPTEIHLTNDAAATVAGSILGTPSFISPEQAGGESSRIDERIDVFGLGAVLCVILTGKPPYEGPNLGAIRLMAIRGALDDAFARLDTCGADPELITLCKRCLAKDRDARPRQAGDVADAVTQLREAAELRTRNAERDAVVAAERAVEQRRKRRWQLISFGVAATMLGLIAVGLGIATVLLRAERDTAQKAEGEAITALAAAQAAELRAVDAEKTRRQQLYRAAVGEARARRTSGRAGQRYDAIDSLKRVLEAIPPAELSDDQRAEMRDEVVAAMALPDARVLDRRRGFSSDRFDVDCDDKLELHAFPDHGARSTVIRQGNDPATDRLLDPYPSDQPLMTVWRRMSPSGRWLSEQLVPSPGGRMRLRIWELPTRRLAFDQHLNIRGDNRIAFDRSERFATVIGSDRVLRTIELASGKMVNESKPRHTSQGLAYSPDGTVIASANHPGRSELLNALTFEMLESPPDIGPCYSTAWSPDGKEVAFGLESGQVYVWNRDWKAGRYLPGIHLGRVVDVRFSPDSQLLATSGVDDLTRIWNVRGNQMLVAMTGRALRFGPDSRRLLVSDDQNLTRYELGFGRPVRFVRDIVEGATFSPDGAVLALAGWFGVRLVHPEQLETLADLGLNDCGPVSFRPDGSGMVTFGKVIGPWHWPIRNLAGRITTGPPIPIIPEESPFEMKLRLTFGKPRHTGRHSAWSGDGKLLAFCDEPTRQVLLGDATGKSPPQPLGVAKQPERVAMSPDGRWIAATSLAYQGVIVWNRERKVVLELPVHGHAAFSPDGKWFASAGRHNIEIRRSATWELVQSIARDEFDPDTLSPLTFNAKNGLLAAATSRQHVRMFDPASGKLAATLTHPESMHAIWLSFSPDGTRLAVTRYGEVAVWDLVDLGIGLRELGLDPFPFPVARDREPSASEVLVKRGTILPGPELAHQRFVNIAFEESVKGNYADAAADISNAITRAPPDLKVRSQLLTKRAEYLRQNGNHSEAIADWLAAREGDPANAEAPVALARAWLFGPAANRDPLRALALVSPLAEKVDAAPQVKLLLASAHVQLGRPKEAIPILNSISEAEGGATRDYLRALALAKSGDSPGAVAALASAKASEVKSPRRPGTADAIELSRLRAEAEANVK